MSIILQHIEHHGLDVSAWEKRGVMVKREGSLLLFKYANITADFRDPLVKEARGLILRDRDGDYEVISRPFDKFFNITENRCPYGPETMDKILREQPERVRVVEKADGTCIQVWYDEDTVDWRASTLGTISPGKASIGDETFDQLFWRTIGLTEAETRLNAFQRGHTYIFELCRPENMIVTQYTEPRVYILGCRTLGGDAAAKRAYKHLPGAVRQPKMWDTPRNFVDLEGIVVGVADLPHSEVGKNPEGVVVYVDGKPAAKMKNLGYLALHRIGGGDYPSAMNKIKQAVIEGTHHEFKDDLTPLLRNYLDRVVRARGQFVNKAIKYQRGVVRRYQALTNKHRSELAKIVKSYDKDYHSVLFALPHEEFDREVSEGVLSCWLLDRARYRKMAVFNIPLEEKS